MEKLKKLKVPHIILLLSPILTGLLSDASIFGIILLSIITITLKTIKNKKIFLPRGKLFWFILFYVFSFILVEPWAIDKGMNVIGFFRASILPIFILLMIQYDENIILHIIGVIPYSGILALGLSVVMFWFHHPDIVIDNRLNGTFLYANSFALFLLLGIFILLKKEKQKALDYLGILILGVGIILTNSRAIMIMTFLLMIGMLFFKFRKDKKSILIISLIIVLIIGIYFCSGIKIRSFSNLMNSSEFQMRIVYYQDAFKMILSHPFGMGYKGYYYHQVEVQSAPYDTKSVHNFVLQLLLDVGLIPGVCMLYVIISGLFHKSKSTEIKGILCIILFHSLIDINLEYYYFWLLMMLSLPFERKEHGMKNAKELVFITTPIIMVYIILLLGSFVYECKNYELAHQIIPFHTDALIQDLYSAKDKNKQLRLTNKIYPLNQNLTAVCQVLSAEEKKENHYLKALAYEKKILTLNRLVYESYEDYFSFLKDSFTYYNEKEEYNNVNIILNEIMNIKERMNEVNQHANPSYVPLLEPSEEMNKTFAAIETLK